MAPIKFEENIKEKLELRSLQPSENAWHSLEQKLNSESKKRNKSKFWWFGIAASIIGLLFVLQQFTSFNNTKEAVSPIIVDLENETKDNTIKSALIIQDEQKVAVEKPKGKAVNLKLANATVYSSKEKIRNTKQELTPKVAEVTENEKTPEQIIEPIISKKKGVASVLDMKNSLQDNTIQIAGSEVSNSEVETLLNAANEDIQLKRKTSNRVSIDANALLENVETEMPPSLRGQLFKVIEKNFKTAKTAVANRND